MSKAEILRLLDLARLGVIHAPNRRIGYPEGDAESAIASDNAILKKARTELLSKKRAS